MAPEAHVQEKGRKDRRTDLLGRWKRREKSQERHAQDCWRGEEGFGARLPLALVLVRRVHLQANLP